MVVSSNYVLFVRLNHISFLSETSLCNLSGAVLLGCKLFVLLIDFINLCECNIHKEVDRWLLRKLVSPGMRWLAARDSNFLNTHEVGGHKRLQSACGSCSGVSKAGWSRITIVKPVFSESCENCLCFFALVVCSKKQDLWYFYID